MKPIQIVALIVIAIFYIAYFLKMFFQHRKGLKTNQIAKGNKPKKVLTIEILMKIATYIIVAVEISTILFDLSIWKSSINWLGNIIASIGVIIFIISMVTMKDSWRAGIPDKDETKLITTGIYRISRNPAFLGFDLMYIGILISFFNFFHLAFVFFAVIMLHLQILQEEKFLIYKFKESYVEYKKKTGRYFIF